MHRPSNRGGRVAGGLLIVAVGAALLAYQLDMLLLPRWVFSWKVLLIIIGLFSGFKHSFRNPGWIVPVLIGGIFLLEDLVPEIELRPYIWPILVIGFGLWIIFKPKHRVNPKFYENGPADAMYPSGLVAEEDFLSGTVIFSGVKRNVITKDFKGGDVVVFFGGAEYNLNHADIQGEAVLHVTQAFGGIKLIVPPHWRVRSEAMAIFGGIDDKRSYVAAGGADEKVLVLKGTVVFGGIEVKSY